MLEIIVINSWLKGAVLGQTRLASQICSLLVNGYYPVARMNRVTPKDHTSLAGVKATHFCA